MSNSSQPADWRHWNRCASRTRHTLRPARLSFHNLPSRHTSRTVAGARRQGIVFCHCSLSESLPFFARSPGLFPEYLTTLCPLVLIRNGRCRALMTICEPATVEFEIATTSPLHVGHGEQSKGARVRSPAACTEQRKLVTVPGTNSTLTGPLNTAAPQRRKLSFFRPKALALTWRSVS